MYLFHRCRLCPQLSDYKYRNRFLRLRFPLKFGGMATAFTLHPTIRFFQKQTAVDRTAYRALYIIGIHNLVLTSDINCLQSLNHMLCYPLDNQLSHKNLLIRILFLISIFEDCPFGFFINTAEHL